MELYHLIVIATAAVLSPAADAVSAPLDIQAKTASELARHCAANPSAATADAEINYCDGFAQGVFDSAHQRDPKLFCIPNPSPKRRATMNEFVSWVRAIPTHGAEPPDVALVHFMGERYPCK